MSDKLEGFIRQFDVEFDSLSADDLRTMGFDRATEEGRAFARDEVFADLFAHAGGTRTNNERSQLMARRFGQCLDYMRRNIREQP
jgi:hypothetical protein